MWWHCFAWPTFAISKNENHCERCNASIHVNDCTTSEVKCAALKQPTVGAEHPVSNGGVHHDSPHAN